jgi:hypothetical protein
MSIDVNPAADASAMSSTASATTVSAPAVRPEHAEGEIARLIEQQTAKIPSHWFLFGAVAAMGASLMLELGGRTRPSRFVGMWPAPLLALGIYNKLVKTLGTR